MRHRAILLDSQWERKSVTLSASHLLFRPENQLLRVNKPPSSPARYSMSQSVFKPVSQSLSQNVSGRVSHSLSHWINYLFGQSVTHSTRKSVSESICQRSTALPSQTVRERMSKSVSEKSVNQKLGPSIRQTVSELVKWATHPVQLPLRPRVDCE